MTRWSCRRPQSIWSCLAQMGYLARRTLRKRRLIPADGGSAPEPGRENIPGCIHVQIVQLTTVSTRPRPHSKVSQTPGSREGATVRTRSRGVSLVNDDDRSAGVLALIQQHLLEHAPTGIQHGGGQPCLRQFQAAHIAYDDSLISVDHPSTELVAGIQPPTANPPMQPLGLARAWRSESLCRSRGLRRPRPTPGRYPPYARRGHAAVLLSSQGRRSPGVKVESRGNKRR
jgi:hypothetical protein